MRIIVGCVALYTVITWGMGLTGETALRGWMAWHWPVERVLVVSPFVGYGIFGGRIAEALARDSRCRVRIVGRNTRVAANFAHRIGAECFSASRWASRCGAADQAGRERFIR